MRLTLKSKRNGILKSQIDTIVKELDRLRGIYPDVIINELCGFVDDDGYGADEIEASYLHENKTIYINRDKARGLLSERETIKARAKITKRIDKRRDMGIVIDNDKVWRDVRGLISLVRHEFCHAIIHTYGLDEDKYLLEMYNSLSEEDIALYLSDYCDCIDEFLAVAYEESFYDDCTNLAKQVRKMIDITVGVIRFDDYVN